MCHGGGGGGGGVLGDHTPSHCYKYHGQVLEKCLPGVVLLKAIDKEGFLSFNASWFPLGVHGHFPFSVGELLQVDREGWPCYTK